MIPTLSLDQQTMTLARLLSQRQWTLLETILTSATKTSATVIDDPSLPHAITADIVIHFAARFKVSLIFGQNFTVYIFVQVQN